MISFTDQLNRTIELKNKPSRIISLVPSQTELLFDLGLDKEVLGITKFCVHPEKWFRNKTRIGGTKTVNINKIKELKPDLIIANKEENVEEQVLELTEHFPVWISDVNTLEDAYKMVQAIGELIGKEKEAAALITRIKMNFSQLKLPTANGQLPACYLIWKDPYMTIGSDTFIHAMLLEAGFKNIFQNRQRYPPISIEDLRKANCQLLLLSSEPFPFKQKHIDELQLQLPQTKIILTDGEVFSWYGSRLLHAPAYFKELHRQINAMV